jgi:hypothetical protein
MENEPIQTAVDPLAPFWAKSSDRMLEPMDRISEILFGLIMALTFTLNTRRRNRRPHPSSDDAPRRTRLQLGLGDHRRQRVSDGSLQPTGAQRDAAAGCAHGRRYR